MEKTQTRQRQGPSNGKAPDDGLETLELPSGGTWTIIVRPKGKHLSRLQSISPAQIPDDGLEAEEGTGNPQADGMEATFRGLAALTERWSFPEEVSVEAIGERDLEDLITVLEVVNRRVLPLFARLGKMNLGS